MQTFHEINRLNRIDAASNFLVVDQFYKTIVDLFSEDRVYFIKIFRDWTESVSSSFTSNSDQKAYLKTTVQKIFSELDKREKLSFLLLKELCGDPNFFIGEIAREIYKKHTDVPTPLEEKSPIIQRDNIPVGFSGTARNPVTPEQNFINNYKKISTHPSYEKWPKTNLMVSFILCGNFDAELLLIYTKDEEIMSEFTQWLENLPLDVLDKKTFVISSHIDKMLSLLCSLKDEKFFDISKVLLKIYSDNNEANSIKDVIRIIFKSNWIEMLYTIVASFSCKNGVLHPHLTNAIQWVWRIEVVLYLDSTDFTAIFIKIQNLCEQQELKTLENLPTLITFLELLDMDKFDVKYLISECSELKKVLEESMDVLTRELWQDAIQYNHKHPRVNKNEYIVDWNDDTLEENRLDSDDELQEAIERSKREIKGP